MTGISGTYAVGDGDPAPLPDEPVTIQYGASLAVKP